MNPQAEVLDSRPPGVPMVVGQDLPKSWGSERGFQRSLIAEFRVFFFEFRVFSEFRVFFEFRAFFENRV